MVRLFPLACCLFALLCMAAGIIHPVLETGYRAFLNKDYDSAIRSYDVALRNSSDPGQIAFQMGAIAAHAERYSDAALAFARCLEDAQGLRRAQAAYGQATALTHVANQLQGRRAVAILHRALSTYDICLRQLSALDTDQASLQGSLPADAAHNRTVAEALLARKLKEPEPPDDRQEPENAAELDQHLTDPGGNLNTARNASPLQNRPPSGAGTDQGNQDSNAGRGNLPPLPDEAPTTPLSADEAHRRLNELLKRLRQPMPGSPTRPGSKDW